MIPFNSIIFSPPSEPLARTLHAWQISESIIKLRVPAYGREAFLGDSERGSFFYASLVLNL